MSWRLFLNLVAAEVTGPKHHKDQSLLTSAATAARRVVAWIAKTLSSRPPQRFAKYQPAPRFGTRPLEDRLLRRLRSTATESTL